MPNQANSKNTVIFYKGKAFSLDPNSSGNAELLMKKLKCPPGGTVNIEEGPAISSFSEFLLAIQGEPPKITADNVFDFGYFSLKWDFPEFIATANHILSLIYSNEEESTIAALSTHFSIIISFPFISKLPISTIEKVLIHPLREAIDPHKLFRFLITEISQHKLNSLTLLSFVNRNSLTIEELSEILNLPNLREYCPPQESSSSVMQQVIQLQARISDQEKLVSQIASEAEFISSPNLESSIDTTSKMISKTDYKIKQIKKRRDTSFGIDEKTVSLEIEKLTNNSERLDLMTKEIGFAENIPSIYNGRNGLRGIGCYFAKSNPSSLIISSLSTNKHSPPVTELLNREFSGCWSSNEGPGQWVMLEFRRKKLKINYYSIKTFNGSPNMGHIKEWALEGSNNNEQWAEIDKRSTNALNGELREATFECDPHDAYALIRIRMTGPNWSGGSKMMMNAFEVFGYLLI